VEEKVKISGFPTAKELRQAKEVAEARLRREEEEAETIGMVSEPSFTHRPTLHYYTETESQRSFEPQVF
jgi:hypothetical protein